MVTRLILLRGCTFHENQTVRRVRLSTCLIGSTSCLCLEVLLSEQNGRAPVSFDSSENNGMSSVADSWLSECVTSLRRREVVDSRQSASSRMSWVGDKKHQIGHINQTTRPKGRKTSRFRIRRPNFAHGEIMSRWSQYLHGLWEANWHISSRKL